jgi:hypothetical protein
MDTTALLGPDAPVPIDRPFTRREALAKGATPAQLASLVREGLIVSPLRGALHAAGLSDGLELRIACAKLVVPADAIVTDRTAGWLHMAPMVLAPGDHLEIPELDLFRPPGNRVKRGSVRSGERSVRADEIVVIEGLRETSKLRTTCDVGMQLPRRQAFAAMCAMMKVADFNLDDIRHQADTRFRGYRWVTQPTPAAGDLLRAGIVRARRRLGQLAWTGQDREASRAPIAGSAPYVVIRSPGERMTT